MIYLHLERVLYGPDVINPRPLATSIIAARLGNCGPRGSHGDQVALNGTFNRAATFNIFYTFYWATQLTYDVYSFNSQPNYLRMPASFCIFCKFNQAINSASFLSLIRL